MTDVLIADFSMFQADYTGDPFNFDQLYDPAHWTVDIDFAAALEPIAGVILRVGLGARHDPCFDRFLAGVRAAGKPWGVYHAFDPSLDSGRQVHLVGQWCPSAPPLGVWGDVEMGAAYFGQTDAYLRALDDLYARPAGLYSGGPYLNSHFSAAEQAAWRSRRLWIAGYPNYWPPLGWDKGAGHTLHQYTDKYQLPGMTKLCDMSHVNPAHPLEELVASTHPNGTSASLTGCLIGGGAESNSDIIPIYTDLAAAGAVPPIIIGVENPGLCVDAKRLGCPTTIARLMHKETGPDHDFEAGGGGRAGWPADMRLRFARASIAMAFDRLNPTEAAAVDYVQCAGNEWDAQDVGEWLQTCDVWAMVLDERDNRQAEYIKKNGKPLRLALGIFNAGTPKTWAMYQAIFSHPVWGRAHAAGDFLGFHEGVAFGQPKDYLYNVPLDGAPIIEGSGLVNFRSDYVLAVLASHGWEMPYGFLEWYDGFTRDADVARRIEALTWVDQHMGTQGPATRKYFRGYCCFELTNNPASAWYRQDFTPVLKDARWKAYAVSQIGRQNGASDIMPITAAQKQSIHDALSVAAAGIAGTLAQIDAIVVDDRPAHVWQAGDVARALANPLQLYSGPDGTVTRTINVTWPIDIREVRDAWLRVTETDWVRAGDLALRV